MCRTRGRISTGCKPCEPATSSLARCIVVVHEAWCVASPSSTIAVFSLLALHKVLIDVPCGGIPQQPMRLAVHHKLKVVQGSVLLAAVLRTNVFLSICIVFPILFSLIGLKWENLDFVDRSWYSSVVVAYGVLEIPRLYMGIKGNTMRSVSSMIGFVTLSMTTHMVIMCVYHAMVPLKNSLDYAISIAEIILAAIEAVLAVLEVRKMVRQNTVNFYVSLGLEA